MPQAIFKSEYVAYDLHSSELALLDITSSIQSLPYWLIFSFFLFFAGVLGTIFNYKNFIVAMMCIELMYLGAATSFIMYGATCDDSRGSIYGLLLLILAACESAVGLGILIVLYRFGRSIDFSAYETLGG